MNYHIIFLSRSIVYQLTLDKIFTFFKLLFSYLLHKVECLIFGLFPFQINSFCILFTLLIISVGTWVARERCMILDIAKVLKIVIFPSTVKFCIFHKFSAFLFSEHKVFFCLKFFIIFYYKKNVFLNFFVVFLVTSIQSIPQSANDTPFRSPMPAISHLASLDFNTELSENLSKAFITSITESSSLRKNIVLMS